MSEESILNKIRALLAKTKEAGCSEAEVASAGAMAARLMAKHGIEMESIAPPKENTTESVQFQRGDDLWQSIVAVAVAKRFGGACFRDSRSMVFFGKGEIPKVAGEVWTWICKEMRRIALLAKSYEMKNREAYMLGMAHTVCNRLKEKAKTEEEQAQDAYAIVRADIAEKEMEKEFDDLFTDGSREKEQQKASGTSEYLIGMIHGNSVVLGTEKSLEN